MKKLSCVGSSLDDFLAEEGILEEVEAAAIKRIIAGQLEKMIAQEGITKTVLANRMETSRAAVNRLLDPKNESVTLLTLKKAASVLGKRLRLELV
jgi:DNA-binding Xre family transcriptional regulator